MMREFKKNDFSLLPQKIPSWPNSVVTGKFERRNAKELSTFKFSYDFKSRDLSKNQKYKYAVFAFHLHHYCHGECL